MADKRISQLPVAGALTGAELAPLVQAGATKQSTLTDYLGYFQANTALGDLSNVDLTGLASSDVLQWDGANWVPYTLVADDTIYTADGSLDSNRTVDGGGSFFTLDFVRSKVGVNSETTDLATANPGTFNTICFTDGYGLGVWTSGGTRILSVDENGAVGVKIGGTGYADAKLHVEGTLKFVTGNQGASKVWVSDADGFGDWATLSYIDGTGTANYVPKWTDADTLGDSLFYDNGTTASLGSNSPTASMFTVVKSENATNHLLRLVNLNAGTASGTSMAYYADGGILWTGLIGDANNTLTTYGPVGSAFFRKDNTTSAPINFINELGGFNWYTNGDATGTAKMTMLSTGLLGINESTPTSNLHVKTSLGGSGLAVYTNGGNLVLKTENNYSVYSNGAGSLTSNTSYGKDAFITNSTGSQNTAFGFEALKLATIDNNTAFGWRALYKTTTGFANVAMGYSLKENTLGQDNVAIGYNVLNSNTIGGQNIAIGVNALTANVSSSENIAIGYFSMRNATGQRNVSVGTSAMQVSVGSEYSTAIGYYAGNGGTTINNCVFVGAYAGYKETASNKLFIDAIQRSTEALGRTESLIYGIFDATVANQVLHINAGHINMDDLPTGRASVSTGELFVDTADNILAAGDLVVARKV